MGHLYSLIVPILSRLQTYKSKLEDGRFVSVKFKVNCYTHDRYQLDQKTVKIQMAFQLYIVDIAVMLAN